MNETQARLEIFVANRPALVAYAVPIVGSRASAEDAVQEAYFRFVPPPGPPATPGSPVSYLFRVVRNVAIDMTRRMASEARRDTRFAATVGDAATVPSPEQVLADREQLALAAAALGELPADMRVAFEMKRMQGATYQEIAERCGVSKATAHRLVQKALTHVMVRLQERNG